MSTAKRTTYAVNAAGGALVSVLGTAGARKVVIMEIPPDGGNYNGANFAAQGLNFTLPDDGFVHIFPLTPGDQIILGDIVAEGRGAGSLQGGPAQQDPAGRTVPARIHAKLISATATATMVEVLEYS